MSTSNVVPAAAAPFSLTWGESPALYLSYGTATLKGVRPELTDAVAAMKSFTALSPPMGLDYFAVLDGRHLGAAVAEHLPARLAGAIAGQVDDELASESPLFLMVPSDVVGWWRTAIQKAFRAVFEEVASEGAAAFGVVVALVLEKYIIVANCGDNKAVLCRGGEHVELTPERRAINTEEKQIDLNSEPADKGDEKQIDLNFDPAEKFDHETNLAFGSGTGSSPPAVVIPELDVMVVERQAQDEFLILGSGGLWGPVAPAPACAFVRQRLQGVTTQGEAPVDARGSPDVLARELANKAVHAGSMDNVGVAIVVFKDFWA